MSRWIIHELFAHIPECHGYLPLSIGFAQFVAVQCDVDPLDRVSLEAELRQSSCAQELMRWFVRLLQAGELRTVSRPLGGGPITPVNKNHWHADAVIDRFISSQYCRADPYSADAGSDSWIFVDESDYLVLWEAQKEELLGQSNAPRATRSRREAGKAAGGSEPTEGHLIGLPAVEALVGLSRSTIYKMVDEGRFPPQVKVKSRALWRPADVARWAEEVGTADGWRPATPLPRDEQ